MENKEVTYKVARATLNHMMQQHPAFPEGTYTDVTGNEYALDDSMPVDVQNIKKGTLGYQLA